MLSELKQFAFIICLMAAIRFQTGFIISASTPIIPNVIITYHNITKDSNISSESKLYEQLSVFYFADKIIYTLITPICGITLEYINSRFLLIFGTISQFTSLLIYGLCFGYDTLIIAKVFESLSGCFLNTSIDSLNSELCMNYKVRGFLASLSKLSINISASIGPFYGGLMYQYTGKMGAFLPCLCLVIPTFILSIKAIIDFYHSNRKKEECHCTNDSLLRIDQIDEITRSSIEIKLTNDDNNCISKSALSLHGDFKVVLSKNQVKNKITIRHTLNFLKDPLFMIVIFSIPICVIPKATFYITLPHYMSLRFKSSSSKQGSVWTLGILGNIIGFFLGNYLNSAYPNERHLVLFIGQIIQAFCIIIIPILPIWWLISVPLCVFVITQMVHSPIAYALLASIVEKRHDSKFGLMSGYLHFVVGVSLTIAVSVTPIIMKYLGFFMLCLILYLINLSYGFLYLFYLKDFVCVKN